LEAPFYDSLEAYEMAYEELEKKVNDIHGVLLGVNGYPGLAKRFEELSDSHYKLKRNFYMLVAFLIGSGILSASIITALN